MDLVDEEHVAVVEVGDDGGKVGGSLQRRARRDAESSRGRLGRQDPGEGRLAQPWGPGKQDMVE